MDALSPTTPARAATPGATQAPTDAAGTDIDSDFDTFLKMLTAQVRNQDPLNPMDASDFASQLATFSGVEQQVLTNELLRDLGAGNALNGLADHAGWVGMDAKTQGDLAFSGAPLTLHFDRPADAVSFDLVVTNPNGLEVQRRSLAGAASPYIWDGVQPSGGSLPAGTYTVSVEATAASGRVSTLPVSSYARISEVRSGADGTLIVLDDGREVAASAVTALRGT